MTASRSSSSETTAMSDQHEFLQSTDATLWAAAFVERAKADPAFATDEGTMIGWFANAIMRGYDEAGLTKEREEAAAFPSSTTATPDDDLVWLNEMILDDPLGHVTFTANDSAPMRTVNLYLGEATVPVGVGLDVAEAIGVARAALANDPETGIRKSRALPSSRALKPLSPETAVSGAIDERSEWTPGQSRYPDIYICGTRPQDGHRLSPLAERELIEFRDYLIASANTPLANRPGFRAWQAARIGGKDASITG